MKSYAELSGNKPFDFKKFLYKKTKLTVGEWEQLENASNTWETCPCGNLCAIIGRDIDGSPIDYILHNLGGNDGFTGAVKNRNIEEAKYFFEAIQLRSVYLIEKEKKTLHTELEITKKEVELKLSYAKA